MNFSNTSSNTQKMQQHNKVKPISTAASALRREEVDLRDLGVVDLRQTQALNAVETGASMVEVMNESVPNPMVSDADEQILFKIMLQGSCAISCLHFFAAKNEVEDASAPSVVKVYCNYDNMDFHDVEDLKPAVTKELEFVDGVAKVPVCGPSFSRIVSLQVLVESNCDDTEKTCIGKFTVLGHQNNF